MRAAHLLLFLAQSACATGWNVPTPPADLASRNPGLAERVARSPHGLFRFVNRSFAAEVCQRFAGDRGPTVNLHGDAHVEQYAVTDLGRGLTDFDDAARGSPAIDLTRMAVSLELTCEANGHECGPILDAFFRSYAATLDAPRKPERAPSWVLRKRAGFTGPRMAVLEDLEALMQPVAHPERLDALIARYREQLLRNIPELDDEFLAVQRRGRLRVGVGSALDEKYLLRIEGPSSAPEDDLFLEIKEVRDLSGVSCLSSVDLDSPLRVIRGEERISYTPYNLVGYVILPEEWPRPRAFWVHEWADHYTEASYYELDDANDLQAIARDIAAQLALGHPRSPDPAVSQETRLALISWLGRNDEKCRAEAHRLTRSIRRAWRALGAR